MEYLYETIEHNGCLPINIFTHTVSNFPYHWHEDTEILFVLKGGVEVVVDNVRNNYREGNVFIVNSNDLHRINSTSDDGITTLLALQFDLNHFSNYGISSNIKFKIEYENEDSIKRGAYNRLRAILASTMRSVINKEEPQQLIIERHLLDLIIVLINNFRTESESDRFELTEQKRIIQIIKYISANCKDRDISLEQVAQHFHLNPQYLSRYFKNQVGISFKKFIDNLRLNKSLDTLKYSDKKIIDIAFNFGFADAKAFYRVFKETLGITPTNYRKEHRIEIEKNQPKDYFSINKKETLSKLFEYLNTAPCENSSIKHIDREVNVDLRNEKKEFRNCATKLATFGYAPHGLRQDFLEQLKMLQKDIGFEYIRFHGIFADQLLVYHKKSNGETYYNFNHVDALIDVLIENKIKPFIELGFMPKDLASENVCMFWWKSNVSPPKDMNKWLDFLEAFIRHIINRYGIDQVSSWYFEFWNEPETSVFFSGDVEVFYHFFKKSYERIKQVDERLRVGGFGTMDFDTGSKWLNEFASLAKRDQLEMDFFTFHVYQVRISKSLQDVFSENFASELNDTYENVIFQNKLGALLGKSDFITECIDSRIAFIKSLGISKDEYFITEFNASPYCRDLVHDTCYNAAYIVKNVLENTEKVSGIGYWTFTDVFEEFRLPQPLFHGGFGLITYNGIKKASFNAYYFLSRLGDELISKSDGMIITKKRDDYQILMYNYCHYNDLYSRFDYSQILQTDRYGVFENQISKRILLNFRGLNGKYIIQVQRVNRNQGSSYDAWVRIGAPETLSEDAYKYLAAASLPSFKTRTEDIVHSISMNVDLEPHEIQLITFKKEF